MRQRSSSAACASATARPTALDGVSFAVGAGQMFGFVGPNGAGQDDAMRIVLGVLAADAGEVLWRGAPIGAEERRRIGYMPEERGLYPKMRVRDQLVYMARLHGVDEARGGGGGRALDGATGDRRAGRGAGRGALARQPAAGPARASRWSTNPTCWSSTSPSPASTPTASTRSAAPCSEEIRARGVPVVFSSHQLELVERLCDSVAIIAAGRIAASGRLAEIEGSLAEVFRERPTRRVSRERPRGARRERRLGSPAASCARAALARLAGGAGDPGRWSSPGSRSSPSSPPAATAQQPPPGDRRPAGRRDRGEGARRGRRPTGSSSRSKRGREPAAARDEVDDEDADAALGPRGLIVGKDPDDALVALLQNAARGRSGEARLRAAGLSPPQPAPRSNRRRCATVEIATGEGEGGTGLAYIGALLLYIALISFGYAIASSVVAEKSSRVVEVILSAIRPVQLLAGKLIGVGLLGLLQIAAIAAVGLVIAIPGGGDHPAPQHPRDGDPRPRLLRPRLRLLRLRLRRRRLAGLAPGGHPDRRPRRS